MHAHHWHIKRNLTSKWWKTADGLSPFCKGILSESFIARNWVIRNLRRIQFAMQEKQLYAECRARLAHLFIKVTVYLPFSFRKKSQQSNWYSMYGNLLPVLAPKVPVLRRSKATRCGINSGTLTDPCIQQNLFSLYCELYLLLICNAYPLVIDIQDVAPGSYQIRPELLQTFQPSYASSIAWISSDYFEPLLLPQ